MTPHRFRKKPVVIEAMQFLDDTDALVALGEFVPFDLRVDYGGETVTLAVPTLEGVHIAVEGDWIIKGVKGEFYPCKPDIFALTYESAEEGAATGGEP